MTSDPFPHLESPPIKEAVVEYRFSHALDPAVKDLRADQGGFRSVFPHEERLFEGKVNFKLSSEGLTASDPDSAVRGSRFRSEDGSRAVAFTQSSMACSRFANYSTREEFLTEVDYALAEYLLLLPDAGEGSVVSRLGVRFINRIEIDAGASESVGLHEYFGGLPTPVSDDPIVRVSIDQQMRSDLRDENSRVRLIGPDVSSIEAGLVAFVLDIDTWRDLRVPVRRKEAIDETLTSLFDMRSRLFFASMRPKARERYGPR